ncbi:hypothetical protein L1049_006969 [Liquidambar formosana]|uniref:Uncharacterized protein n=1 Tax=Liquidambar formosana TaxID=63359 RepID=A0AAP0RJT8_LIQFO
MAIDVCSEISTMAMSPRISFSHDLSQTDAMPTEQYNRRCDASLLDPNSDFNFCISGSFTQEPSSADELFSNGKILPMQIKKKPITTKTIHPPFQAIHLPPQPMTTSTAENANKKRLKEFLAASCEEEENPSPPSKSFWQFRRSSSLNCDNARSRSLIRPLNFLSRSNSTGSAPNPKQTMLPKDTQKLHSQKQPSTVPAKSSASCTSTYYPYNPSQKPPLLKKNCRSYGNGVRISPVLNLPPHYISKGSASLFGLGSIFCNGKDKRKKK